MLRRILVIVVGLLGLAVAAATVGLAWAHLSLRREEGPLPNLLSLTPPAQSSDLPTAVSYINTASQAMPRAAVLDPASDPSPEAPYVMSHPSFVLRWADGRLLLVDSGMTPAVAIAFGRPLEWVAEAEPVQPHLAVAKVLADHAGKVGGMIFTHLHTDHVGGLGALCQRRQAPLPIFMTGPQANFGNYTTRPGRALIEESGCGRVEELSESGLSEVPGFPGVLVFPAGGHTPGTQVVLAWVRSSDGVRLYAFLGDVVNNIDGINHNISKPFLYRLLVVPEDDTRLAALRVLLAHLRDERGAVLLPAHDQLAIEASGVEMYGG